MTTATASTPPGPRAAITGRASNRAGRVAVAMAIAVAAAASPAVAAPTPVGHSAAETSCTAPTGPYQREMEEFLGLPVDGRQSETDCRVIQAFQKDRGLKPADGYAGIPTYRTMLVMEAMEDPNAEGQCPTGAYTVACIDLTRQLLWVQQGAAGRVVYDPVPVRSGRRGLETRGGMHEIYWRSEDHWSTIYDVAMPYAQFFNGGQAIHGTEDDLFKSGSGGCVNLYMFNAAELWDLLGEGDKVFVYGVKPGTSPRAARPDVEGRSPLSDEELVAEGMKLLPPPPELSMPTEWDTRQPPPPDV